MTATESKTALTIIGMDEDSSAWAHLRGDRALLNTVHSDATIPHAIRWGWMGSRTCRRDNSPNSPSRWIMALRGGTGPSMKTAASPALPGPLPHPNPISTATQHMSSPCPHRPHLSLCALFFPAPQFPMALSSFTMSPSDAISSFCCLRSSSVARPWGPV